MIEKYKKLYGDGKIELEGRELILPLWLVRLFLDQAGLTSKKNRIRRKILKKQVTKAIVLGLKDE